MDALLQMPRYDKFLKDLLKKKRVVDVGTIEVSHHCSAIMGRNLSPKREDPRAFTIPYTTGVYFFNKALCDMEARINLIPHMIFKKLGLESLKPTQIRLLMVDRSIKRLFDVLVKVDKFSILTDFVVLDFDVDLEVSIILVCLFLDTR